MPRKDIDLLTTNHGTIITIEPMSDHGREWVAENVDSVEAMNGETFHCEPRQGIDILHAALTDGLSLQDSGTGRTA